MVKTVNLLKLSVGTENVEGLAAWQQMKQAQAPDGLPRHVTRMWRGNKGVILVRQRIVRLDEVTRADGIRRCAIVSDPELIRVEATPKRAFQGWRYLTTEDAPRDLSGDRSNEDSLPPSLSKALADIGVR